MQFWIARGSASPILEISERSFDQVPLAIGFIDIDIAKVQITQGRLGTIFVPFDYCFPGQSLEGWPVHRPRERAARQPWSPPSDLIRDTVTLSRHIPEIETQIGVYLTRIVADCRYRGHNAPPDHKFKVYISGQRRRGMSRCLLKLSKRSLRIEIYAASAI